MKGTRRKSAPGNKSPGTAGDHRQNTRRREAGEKRASDGPRTGVGRNTPPPTPPDSLWLYGIHAVLEALQNTERTCHHLLQADTVGGTLAERIQTLAARRQPPLTPKVVQRRDLDRLLGAEAVHQGIALNVAPLVQPDLAVFASGLTAQSLSADQRATVLALDQVTDPHNVGAILRSAAAFGAAAVVTTQRNAPPESGTLAKAASGALEHVPYIQETNLARSLETLREAGFVVLGLAEDGEAELASLQSPGRAVLVLGAEGKGLRRLTRETCDHLVRLPTRGPIGALNVSNAAAVGLYELAARAE